MRYQYYFFLTVWMVFLGLCYFFWPVGLWSLVLFIPLLIWGLIDIFQVKRTLMRNYPLFGRFRYFMEYLRPKIYQYFVESDIDGAPINRIHRSVVYQRAKRVLRSTPFGTQLNVYQEGYEWINHSLSPKHPNANDLRVTVGGPHCKHPYSASIFNISAMSFGSLSRTAIEALSSGAAQGNFAHNTGEGSVSPYHERGGADLIWQVGTGYFGCRTKEGNFDADKFAQTASHTQVKMIELKLSQGAKPGHGGILPAKKNTHEIASIRGVEPFTQVNSPPMHTAFNGARGLLEFITKLRELSGGKPVGFKMCFGNEQDFRDICKEMKSTGMRPDFITIDGGEGGTGAAPLEFSDSIGTPLKEGLAKAHDLLTEYGLKQDIKLICSGKILTGFDIVRAIALGADLCNCARGMMLALGCIQALECNNNHCPTGVATQNPMLYRGLDVVDKASRVKNYHHETIHSVAEIIAAAGLDSLEELRRDHIFRRVGATKVKTFAEIFPGPLQENT